MTPGREAELKRLKRSMQWAIYPNNMVGLPLLALFVGSVLNLRFGNLMATFRGDTFFLPYSLGLIGSVALCLVFLHFALVWSFVRPLRDYLAAGTASGQKPAVAALEAILGTPFRTMLWSMIFYVAGVFALMIAIQLIYPFSWTQRVMLFIGSVSAGTVVSFFEFFTSKRALHPYMERLVEDFPGLALDEKYNRLLVGIRSKLLLSVVILAVVLVILTGVLGYSFAIQSYKVLLGKALIAEAATLEPRLVSALAAGAPAPELSALVQELKQFPEDQFILRSPSGANLLGTALTDQESQILGYLTHGLTWEQTGRRPLITRLDSSGVYSAIIARQSFTVAHYPLPSSAGDLVMITSAEPFKRELQILVWFDVIAIFIALVLAFGYTFLPLPRSICPCRASSARSRRWPRAT